MSSKDIYSARTCQMSEGLFARASDCKLVVIDPLVVGTVRWRLRFSSDEAKTNRTSYSKSWSGTYL